MERELGNEETKDSSFSSSRVNEILLGRDTPEVALIEGREMEFRWYAGVWKKAREYFGGGEFLQRGEDGSWVNEDEEVKWNELREIVGERRNDGVVMRILR